MHIAARSGLALLAVLAVSMTEPRAQGPAAEDRPALFKPLRPQTRQELARREARQLYGLGQMRLHEDRLVEATRIFEEALQLDPEATPLYKALIPLYLALSRNEDARKACRKALDLDPGDYETWTLYARQLKNQGQLKQARDALVRALACPALVERVDLRLQMNYDLGALCEELKEYDQAVEAFGEVVKVLDHPQALMDTGDFNLAELKEQAANTHERRVKLCIEARQYERALRLFAEARDKHPVLARRLNFSLARAQLAQGQPEKALEYLDAYLHTQPQGIEPHELRATILKQLHREEEIVPALKEYSERDSKNVALRLFLVRQYVARGRSEDWREAEEVYEKLTEEAPSAEVYRGLFTLYRTKLGTHGGMAQVLQLLNTAIDGSVKKGRGAEGNAQSAAKARAMLLALREDATLAHDLVPAGKTALVNGTALNGQTLQYLAVMARRTRQLAEAEAFYRSCIAASAGQRGEHLIYMGLIDVLYQAHKYEALVEVCRQGIEQTQTTNHGLFYSNQARALAYLGKADEAVAAADRAVEIAHEDDRFWARRTRLWVLIRLDRFAPALAEGQAMLKDFAQPGQAHDVHLLLSNVYAGQRDFAHAEEQIQLVLKEDPTDATANNDLGYLWADQGKNLDEAERLIRKALALDEQQRTEHKGTALDEDAENAAYLDSLGWVLFRRGHVKEARVWLEKASALAGGEEDPTVWDHLGDVYFRLAEPARARTAWEKAVHLYENERLRKADDHYKELKNKLQLLAE